MELYLYFPYMSPLNVLSGAEVKNEWSCTIIPPVCLRGMDRDYFTFTLHNTVNLSLSEPCLELLTERLL